MIDSCKNDLKMSQADKQKMVQRVWTNQLRLTNCNETKVKAEIVNKHFVAKFIKRMLARINKREGSKDGINMKFIKYLDKLAEVKVHNLSSLSQLLTSGNDNFINHTRFRQDK